MNKRFLTAICLLGIVLILIAVSTVTVCSGCDAVLRRTKVLCSIPEGTPAEHTAEALSALQDVWLRSRAKLQFFVPNQQLNEINREICRLPALLGSGCDELSAELSAVRADLTRIREQACSLF